MPGLVRHIQEYSTRKRPEKYVLLMCGFGGSIWQLRRLIRVLNGLGYYVTAMDFSEGVLSKGDVTLLPALVDEVVEIAERRQKEVGKPVLLVGVSLGALLSLNILRRSQQFNRAVLITGGDIAKVAQRLYGARVWPQSYQELATAWAHINMYTEPTQLAGKQALMVLPKRDKLIDPDDVRNEVRKLQEAGVRMELIERRLFGHVGTIIEEAVLIPARTKNYIRRVNSV